MRKGWMGVICGRILRGGAAYGCGAGEAAGRVERNFSGSGRDGAGASRLPGRADRDQGRRVYLDRDGCAVWGEDRAGPREGSEAVPAEVSGWAGKREHEP